MRVIDRDLALFLVMAQTLNISKAADQLGVQQSGLSKALRRVEEQFKEKLFIRRKAGLELTKFGLTVRESLIAVEDQWSRAVRDKLSDLAEVRGSLTIGAHASVAHHVLPRILPRMIEQYPKLDFDFTLARSTEINRKILNFELDMGFVVNPLPFPDLVIRVLGREALGFWRSNSQPSPPRAKGVASPCTVFYNPETIDVERILRRLKPTRRIPVPSYELVASLVSETPCLGLLPELVGRRYPDLRLEGEPFLPAQLCLVYRKERFDNAPRRQLVTQILRILGDSVSRDSMY